MRFLAKLAFSAVKLILIATVLSSAAPTFSDHSGADSTPTFVTFSENIIDKSLSILPDSAEKSAKNMLTALDLAVSNMTQKVIDFMNP